MAYALNCLPCIDHVVRPGMAGRREWSGQRGELIPVVATLRGVDALRVHPIFAVLLLREESHLACPRRS